MSDRLLLRLAPDGSLAWLRRSADGRPLTGGVAGAPPAAALESAREIVVLVPAEDVLLIEGRVAARSRAQLLKALPFVVEDQLLSPVEELHFAAATPEAGEAIGVAVVARAKLCAWLDRLAETGIRPDAVVPETLALPLAPDSASVVIESHRAVARLAPWSAFACGTGELADWLAHAGAAGERALEVFDFRAAPPLALPIESVAYHERQNDPLAFFARNLGVPPLNLLGGEFAPAHHQARGTRWWRCAAALAALVVLLAFARLGVEVVQLKHSAARIDLAVQDSVRKAFPQLGTAELARVDPMQLMQGRLQRLRGGAESSGLLRLLGQIAPVLGSTTRIQTRGMEYRNGTLELGLRAPDVATLDNVRERFALVPGLKVEVTAANPTDTGVDGRIRISGGAP